MTSECDCEVCRNHKLVWSTDKLGGPGSEGEKAMKEAASVNEMSQQEMLKKFLEENRMEDQAEYKTDTIKKNNHDVDEMVRGKALKKALEIINGERQDSYGNPEDSFKLIAKYWTTFLENHGICKVVSPRDVAEMMALFKIARMSGQKTTADNYADAAGYIGIAGDMI